MKTLPELMASPEPWVIAHRGYSGRCPENTMAAFEAAVAAGADMIELDVALSKDRVPVVIHDDTLDRTTDARGPVDARTAKELLALDAGGWFAAEFRGERIPTVEQVFERLRGRIAINVELKVSAFEREPKPDAVEAQVLQLIGRFELEDSVLLSSFERGFLPRIAGRVRIGLLYDGSLASIDAAADCHAHGAISCHADAEYLTRDEVHALREAGIRVVPYTVDQPSLMRTLLDWGVGGVFTNEPDVLRRLLSER